MSNLDAAYNAIMFTMFLKFGWNYPTAMRSYRRGIGKDRTKTEFLFISLFVYIVGMGGIGFFCTFVYVLIEKLIS